MSNPFVAEIRIFTGNFAPKGWALCDGQLMPISQNTALFSLLGTTYGGDGKSNFALPNLQGCLLQTEMPAHSHNAQAALTGGGVSSPANNAWASGLKGHPPAYAPSGTNAQMNPFATSITGGNLPHNNMPPFLGLTFIIALQGVFPARS